MQPKTTLRRIALKEITLFFSSPIAYLFLAAFAAVTLFTFFWGKAFFARNIADVRPLFEWMPLLLIFLASTLTMRMWSEERRSGTLEHVLTQPVPLWHFVVGKFLGCMALLSIALLITLPLPITVSILGDLDWGPVISGYVATLLLGAAYLSIGLFVSARSDNQIVSLISAVALCGFFYLLGNKTITDFFSTQVAEWLRLLSTGARFEAITRGVLDLRDLYYYLSLIVVFLALNTFALERERWAASGNKSHHRNWQMVTGLVLANALLANLWLGQIHSLRLDATEGNQFSISPATERYLSQLQEPLLMRGYFSAKTHPLLSPLVPQIRDLMKEYEVKSNGKVRVEFIDPATNPELEEEANQKYAINPVPFQVADRYQAAVVNSYFNVLVQYGDEYQVLSFRDLIEVKTASEPNIEVQLRNPEHDLTRAIKKVLHSYQAAGNLFDTVKGELVFNAYVSPEAKLPKELLAFKNLVQTQVKKQQEKSANRLQVHFLDPEAEGGKLGEKIGKEFGFKPMTTNLLSNDRFYFYLTLSQGSQVVSIPLEDLSEASFERNLNAAIKRFASGFTKKVALVTPAPEFNNPHGAFGGPPPRAQFDQLEQFLGRELSVISEDLKDGSVNGEADVLLVAAPKNLNETQLFAIDQFLMQGGTVILASAPYSANVTQRNISLDKTSSGLESWLEQKGIKFDERVIMDKQSVPLPIPVQRNVGGFSVQEMRMMDYPYFLDVRDDGLNASHPVTNGLPQVTMAWASPINLDAQKHNGLRITELMHSSEQSWLGDGANVMPELNGNLLSSFTPNGEQKSQLVGLIAQGKFTSWFAGKNSPLAKAAEGKPAEGAANPSALNRVIEQSPDSARIILFSSNEFLNDSILSMAGVAGGGQYLNSLQMLANSVDYAVEDDGLASIRSRGNFNRTLPAMEESTQAFWEYLNYGLALAALVAIGLIQRYVKRAREQQYQIWMAH